MKKTISLLGILLPFACFAQVVITGRVLNQADTKPVANASVFLNNTTLGDKTTSAGAFAIHNVKPGKYELIISIVGFDTYQQPVIVGYNNLELPDITIFSKAIGLSEVTVKSHNNPHRAADLEMFKREFLGTSVAARECTILNPKVLNVEYNDTTSTLTASSDDFLEIENDALGYILKYKLTKFLLQISDANRKNVFFQGSVFFSEMKGTPTQQNNWEIRRQEAYDNSPMHFLRAALAGKLDKEGFRVQQYAIYANPERPPDSLINSKIKYYKGLKSPSGGEKDSLSMWNKRSKLVPTLEKLMPWFLSKNDFIETTSRPGVYLLNCDNDGLFVDFSKTHKYRSSDNINYAYNDDNEENTLIKFNGSNALFDGNGIVFDLGEVTFVGAWGKHRLAEFLPYDYTPLQNNLQANDDEHVVAGLEKYLTDHPVEKAYLQFDKPCYAAGDTVYFKAYVTAGEQHKLSGLSGVLHVDLVNPKNQIDRSVKLQLDSGLAQGDFTLPDTLPTGNYRIRAYTQLMRNFGENTFFDRAVSIVSAKALKIPESQVKQPGTPALKPDVQFFPEGGSMVAGVPSKIAFKAIGINGAGIGIKGSIIDNDGKEVTKFESAHLGMGAFYITPADGKTYQARINYPDGKQDVIGLPKPSAGGLTLSVNNDSIPKATVRIEAGADYFKQNRGKTYALVIYASGSATTVNCKLDSPVIKLDILKRKLHTGVVTVTLFSAANEPLAERLLFIQNYDQLNLNVAGDKNSYAPRDRVSIKLNALNRRGDPATGHFSVSVTDESKFPPAGTNADNILTNLLLTSDLKGYVEQPAYYFADNNLATRQNLDLLMLTQGFRRFEWKNVLDSAGQPLKFQPESGLEIAGQVKSLSNNPVARGAVTLLQPKGSLFLNTFTDDKGMFRFANLSFSDSAQYVLSAVNADKKNTVKITYLQQKPASVAPVSYRQPAAPVTDSVMQSFVANEKTQQQTFSAVLDGKTVALKEVNVHAKKPDDQYRTESLAGAGGADQVMHAEELEQIQGPLVNSLDGRLRGVTFVRSGFHKVPVLNTSLYNGMKGNAAKAMLVIIDGAHVDPDDMNLLNSTDVETVELLKYASASIYGVEGAGGVLVITTKRTRGLNAKDIPAVGVLPVNLIGFYKAREFYSPKYENALVRKQPDLRSTIYWNPEIQTDATGNASFDFYNADGTGNYKVTVEGIDKDGNIGRQVYFYEVK